MLNRENAYLDVSTTFFPKKSSQNLGFISGIVSSVGVAALALATNGCSPDDPLVQSRLEPESSNITALTAQQQAFDNAVNSAIVPTIKIDDGQVKDFKPEDLWIEKPLSFKDTNYKSFMQLSHHIAKDLIEFLAKNYYPHEDMPIDEKTVQKIFAQIVEIFKNSDPRIAKDLNDLGQVSQKVYMNNFLHIVGYDIDLDFTENGSMILRFSKIAKALLITIDDGYNESQAPGFYLEGIYTNELAALKHEPEYILGTTGYIDPRIKIFQLIVNHDIEKANEWEFGLSKSQLLEYAMKSVAIHEGMHILNNKYDFLNWYVFMPVRCSIPSEYYPFFNTHSITPYEIDELSARGFTLATTTNLYAFYDFLLWNSSFNSVYSLPFALPEGELQSRVFKGWASSDRFFIDFENNEWTLDSTHRLGKFILGVSKALQSSCEKEIVHIMPD